MLYKRSSFLTWLRIHCECEITPLRDKNVLRIQNGPAQTYMYLDGKDRIDYEEIYSHYKKLCLAGLPGEKDLERAE